MALASEPVYCNRALWTKPLTPSQWQTCWNYGWDKPVSHTVQHAGFVAGESFLPVIAAAVVVALIVLFIRSRRRAAGFPSPEGG